MRYVERVIYDYKKKVFVNLEQAPKLLKALLKTYFVIKQEVPSKQIFSNIITTATTTEYKRIRDAIEEEDVCVKLKAVAQEVFEAVDQGDNFYAAFKQYAKFS